MSGIRAVFMSKTPCGCGCGGVGQCALYVWSNFMSGHPDAHDESLEPGTFVWARDEALRGALRGVVVGRGRLGLLVKLNYPLPWLPKGTDQRTVEIASGSLERANLLDGLAHANDGPQLRAGFRDSALQRRVKRLILWPNSNDEAVAKSRGSKVELRLRRGLCSHGTKSAGRARVRR